MSLINCEKRMLKRENEECGGCGREERWLLHNVRHRAAYRRLCTNCVLKNHQGLFCPFCYHLYDDDDCNTKKAAATSPEKEKEKEKDKEKERERVMCLKCPSISHLSCIPFSHPHSPPSFLCPSCSATSPSFLFFNPNFTHPDRHSFRALDKDSARALVAAAKIAALSMAKAADVARVEAERRVKEASLAKKRAREALEKLASLAAKDKDKDRDTPLPHTNNKRPRPDSQFRNGNADAMDK